MPRESLDAQVNALRCQCNRCGIAFGCRNHDTLCCIKGTINACLDGYTFQEERAKMKVIESQTRSRHTNYTLTIEIVTNTQEVQHCPCLCVKCDFRTSDLK